MRRFFAFLLVTPLLASCSDSVTPVAPSDVTLRAEESVDTWDSPFAESTSPWEFALGESMGDVSQVEDSPLQSAPAPGAVMYFGNPGAGSSFPLGHDESFHGRDRVVPGAVTVDVGEKVTFIVFPGHRVAIYKPGTNAQDINPGTGTFVLDPNNRLAIQSAPVPQLSIAIHKPGTYLVICAVRRHFVDANMWGWIHVRG